MKWTTGFFFFNDTATTEIYTLSLHDALPISSFEGVLHPLRSTPTGVEADPTWPLFTPRSEEHTSELQSQSNVVCRLLLDKKHKRDVIYRVAHLDLFFSEVLVTFSSVRSWTSY